MAVKDCGAHVDAMRDASRVFAVQAATAAGLGKFALLAAHDLIAANGFELTKTYALVLGLVTPFLMAASLRARIVLLSDATNAADIPRIKRLLLIATVVGIVATTSVLAGTPYLGIGLLMAGAKIFENLLGIQVAELQRNDRRDDAIRVRLSRNLLSMATYLVVFASGSLAWTLFLEMLVGAATVVMLERQSIARVVAGGRSYWALLRDSFMVSAAAFFNAAVGTLILRALLAGGYGETAKLVGIIATGLNLSGRALAETNLFFRGGVDRALTFLSTGRAGRLALAGTVVAVLPLVTFRLNIGSVPTPLTDVPLWVVAAIAFLLNAYGFAIRNSLLLKSMADDVAIFHVVECLLVVLLFVPTADAFAGVLALFASRLMRALYFSRQFVRSLV